MKNSNINSKAADYLTTEIEGLAIVSNEVETWVQAIHPRTGIEIANVEVSTFGNVRRASYKTSANQFRKARLLTVGKYSTEYRTIKIDGKYHKVHRLLFASFYKRAVRKSMVIDHINEIKSDNRIANLQEISTSQNCKKAIEHKKSLGLEGRKLTPVILERIADGYKVKFDSIGEACSFIGANFDNLKNCCLKNIKQIKGFTADFA
jgi:hypothetical protein